MFFGAFFMEKLGMEKTEKSKVKDTARIKGKKWIDLPTFYKDRRSGAGVSFTGKYISG